MHPARGSARPTPAEANWSSHIPDDGRLLLVGYYGGGNFGDELLLEVLMEGLQGRQQPVEVLYQRPNLFPDLHDTATPKVVDARRPVAVLRAFCRARTVVVGGGGIWGMDVNRNVVYLGALLLLARALGKRVLLLGVGYYDSTGFLGHLSAALAAKAASTITARDAQSARNFSRWTNRVRLTEDLAFSLRSRNEGVPPAPTGLLPAPSRNGARLVVVSWRRFRPADANPWHDVVQELPKSLPQASFALLALEPEHMDPDGYQRARRLAAECGNVSFVEFKGNPLELVDELHSARDRVCLLAPQYHAMVVAHLAEIPFYPVAYDDKVTELLRGLGKPPQRIADVATADLASFLDEHGALRSPRPLHRGGPLPVPQKRRSRRLAYVVPALIAFGVVVSWFRPGHFVAHGDVPPFERRAPVAEAFSIWGHQSTSAGSPSYGVARLPELAVVVASDKVGISAETAQRLFFGLIAASVTAAAVFFAFALVESPFAAGSVGLLAFFNPFTLQRLPNVLTLWALMVMAMLGGLVLRSRTQPGDLPRSGRQLSPPRPFVVGVCSMLACYLALNPPLLVVTIAWTGLAGITCGLMWGRSALFAAYRLLARSLPWVILLNLWWAVPFGMTLLGGESSFSAETSISNWQWTHARNSLANVVSLSGSWAWGSTEYFPYARQLDRAPWGALKFGLPVLAASAVLMASVPRRLVLGLFASAVLMLLVAKGTHPPLGGLNKALYDHVPAMYLLREPLGKLGPVLLLVMLALAGLALQGAFDRSQQPLLAVRAGVIALVAAALVYPTPLWTGEVVKGPSGRFPSAHVALPQEWKDVAAHLNGSPNGGKVLVLPINDFYMVPTTWGYYGSDLIPRWQLERPAIQPLKEGYFADSPSFRQLVERTEQALLARDVAEIPRLLQALGASDVVLRKDIDRTFPGRRLLDPALLRPGLERTAGLVQKMSTSVADVYSVTDGRSQVYSAHQTVPVARESTEALVGSTAMGLVARPSGGAPSHGHVLRTENELLTFASAGGAHSVKRHLVRGLPFDLRTVGKPPTALEIVDAAAVEVDGRPAVLMPSGLVQLPASRQWAAVAGTRLLQFREGASSAVLKPGDVVSSFDTARTAPPPAPASFSGVGDCAARDSRSLAAVGIAAESMNDDAPAVRLQAREHVACATLPFPAPAPDGSSDPALYRLTFDYRTVAGKPARFCAYETRSGRCAPLPPLTGSGDWRSYDEIVVSRSGAGPVQLFVYADGDSPGGETTITEYRKALVTGHRPHGRWTVPAETTAKLDLQPGEHTLRVPVPKGDRPTELSDVGDCNRSDPRSLQEVGIEALPIAETRPSVRLRAREHRACVSLPVPSPPETRFRISFQYRNVSGATGSICLYQADLRRCAEMPPLRRAGGWQRYDEVVVPEPGTRSLRLFLYADGAGDEVTTVEYRDVRVSDALPFDVVVAQGVSGQPSTLSRWRRTGDASYEIEIPASTSSRTVVLTESYSPSWAAITSPTVELEHFRANGYANAWTLPPGPPVVLKASYGPNRLLPPLFVLCAITLLVGVGPAVRSAWTKLRKQARNRTPPRPFRAPGP